MSRCNKCIARMQSSSYVTSSCISSATCPTTPKSTRFTQPATSQCTQVTAL